MTPNSGPMPPRSRTALLAAPALALAVCVLLVRLLDQDAGPITAGLAGVALAALMTITPTRRALVAQIGRTGPAGAVVLILVGYCLFGPALFGAGLPGAAPAPIDTQRTQAAALGMAGMAGAACAVGAGARVVGRRRIAGLLMSGVVLGMVLAAAIAGPAAPEPWRATLAAGGGLLFVLAAFQAGDEAFDRHARSALTRRLLLPVAAGLTGLWAVLQGPHPALILAALAAAVLAVGCLSWRRPAFGIWRRWAGVICPVAVAGLLGLLVFASFDAQPWAAWLDQGGMAAEARAGAALAAVRPETGFGLGVGPVLERHVATVDMQRAGLDGGLGPAWIAWRLDLGLYGLSLAAAAIAVLLGQLALGEEQARRPSRGLALALGVAAYLIIGGWAGPVFAGPAIAFAVMLFGLAGASLGVDET